MKVVAYADGASRGNPGLSSFGAVVFDTDGNTLREVSQAIGRTTNNVAEYRGAIAALEAALDLGASDIELRMDSQLAVRQLTGRYKVRAPGLIPLHERARQLLSSFDRASVEHVPRERNKDADRLANAALDGNPSP